MYYLLYQAYGSDEIAYEAIYCLLSLCRIFEGQLPNDIQPVIYTDREELFRKWLPELPIKYHLLTTQCIAAWKGTNSFVHRLKIKMLQDFALHYNNNSVLYIDTDTTFIQNPVPVLEKVALGQQMMHTYEYSLNDKTYYAKKISKLVTQHPYRLSNGSGISIPRTTKMWNAGAIGLAANSNKLLEQALELTDALYERNAKHVMEQLAFSYVLAKNGDIEALDGYIYHYWNFKEFRLLLKEFFEQNKGKTLKELIALIASISPHHLVKPKLAFKQQAKIKQLLLKMVGRGWALKDYSFYKVNP